MMLSEEREREIVQLLLRVPPEERSLVLDLIRAICPTAEYQQEREECLRRMGIPCCSADHPK